MCQVRPTHLNVLYECHDMPINKNIGISKTMELINNICGFAKKRNAIHLDYENLDLS